MLTSGFEYLNKLFKLGKMTLEYSQLRQKNTIEPGMDIGQAEGGGALLGMDIGQAEGGGVMDIGQAEGGGALLGMDIGQAEGGGAMSGMDLGQAEGGGVLSGTDSLRPAKGDGAYQSQTG